MKIKIFKVYKSLILKLKKMKSTIIINKEKNNKITMIFKMKTAMMKKKSIWKKDKITNLFNKIRVVFKKKRKNNKIKI